MTIAKNLTDNITNNVREHVDMLRAHDAVHPDRNDCGGVGGCAIMRAEFDTREAVVDSIEHAARHGYTIRVQVSK